MLAATAEGARWREDAAALFAAADGAGSEAVEQVHVGTERARSSLFVTRAGAVVVTDRFALASLMFFDMRSTCATWPEGRLLCRRSLTESSRPRLRLRRRGRRLHAAAASPAAPSPGSTAGGRATTTRRLAGGTELFVAAGA